MATVSFFQENGDPSDSDSDNQIKSTIRRSLISLLRRKNKKNMKILKDTLRKEEDKLLEYNIDSCCEFKLKMVFLRENIALVKKLMEIFVFFMINQPKLCKEEK